jgi:hypothetical protein
MIGSFARVIRAPNFWIFSVRVFGATFDFKFAQVVGTLGAEWLVATPGLYFVILLQNKQCPTVSVMTCGHRLLSVVVSGCFFAIQILKSFQNLFFSLRRNAVCASDASH